MVDLHGGSVSVSSEGLGKGSQFDVRLPALDLAERGLLAGERSSPGAEPSSEALRVLVVDDNQDAAEMLVEVLRSFGHDTQAAYDGPATLRLCRAFVPDVALLDIGLPVMDGYELADRMRELPGLAGVRLVAVTGYGQDSDRERSRRSGFHHHLVKPIDIDALDGVIREQTPSV
jgi:CheY-like chemotaxis protein